MPTVSHKRALTGAAGELLVAAELLRRGIDVAVPMYDRGIDLIAYREDDFSAVVPVQIKASSGVHFGFDKEWFCARGTVLVHVWNAAKTPEFFVFGSLSDVEDALGHIYSSSPSWVAKGAYSNTRPGPDVLKRMEPHRDRWDRITGRLAVAS